MPLSYVTAGGEQQMTAEVKRFPAQKLEAFCTEVLTKAGLAENWAAVVAESLLSAELRGIKSHGVVRLETYIQRVETGVMKIQAPVTTEMDEQAVALLNANNTFGQIAGHRAMSLAIDKAKQYGVGVVAVKNSNHFGIGASCALLALKGRRGGWVF